MTIEVCYSLKQTFKANVLRRWARSKGVAPRPSSGSDRTEAIVSGASLTDMERSMGRHKSRAFMALSIAVLMLTVSACGSTVEGVPQEDFDAVQAELDQALVDLSAAENQVVAEPANQPGENETRVRKIPAA